MDPGRPSFERGVFHLDGKPLFLLSGDYPYYRDRRDHWRSRLEAIQEAGIRIVTTYVPWRHHAPADALRGGGTYDFDGSSQANRDVRGFLRLCDEMGLLVIVKPGPFVHAELRYGGLPDYVDPGLRSDIEPERDGSGEPYRWTAPGGEQARALPAPLDETFCRYVQDWFTHVTREALAPYSAPRGPIVCVQVLNEGIYSDSASGLIPSYGYSESSTRAWWRFLASSYRSVERYNELHGSRHARWEDIPAPAAVAPAGGLASVLTYLDRSRFTHALYTEVLRRYVSYLWDAGLDRDIPLLMNFCPNINSFRRHVASNDGWYSKVAWHPRMGVQWGHTDWIGVAEHDPRAYLQYVLAATRERGPNVEENWGFSGIYDPSYAFTQPSYFQSLLSIAAGATGLNVYTMIGTSAWREDHNIDTVGIPRVTGARPPLDEDYPGHAPVGSDGTKTAKYWTIAQLAHHFAAEGASLVGERRVDIAWAVYPPYAWAGAWAPAGDEDEAPWLEAGLRAMPRVTYRALEAFLEVASKRSLDVAQVNVKDAGDDDLARFRCLVLAGYDFMDVETQRKLVSFVERGGVLLVTGLLPTLNEHLASTTEQPLRSFLFDHSNESLAPIPTRSLEPIRRSSDTAVLGLARDWVVSLDPPQDAMETLTDAAGRVVGYSARRREGVAIYAGFRPWFTAAHGDDPRLVDANRRLVERSLAATSVRLRYARAIDDTGEVDVWQYGAFQQGRLERGRTPAALADIEHLAIVNRAATPAVREIESTRHDGSLMRFRVALVPNTVCLVTFEHGLARSLLLKCVNDHDGISVPPFLEEPGGTWIARSPCDLCVTRPDENTIEIAVAQAARETVEIEVPIAARRVSAATDAAGRPVPFEATPHGISVRVRDMRIAGVHRLLLRNDRGKERAAAAAMTDPRA